jgi:hypothetical protein
MSHLGTRISERDFVFSEEAAGDDTRTAHAAVHVILEPRIGTTPETV